MFLIVSCSSLYLCLFAKLLGQSKSTCCSAKLSTLRLFSLSSEQSVRWKRIPWSRSCECLSVHQQPGFFAQSIAWEQHGTTRQQKPPAIRTLMISQHAADYAKIYAIVPSCSIYFQHVSTILEISAGNVQDIRLEFTIESTFMPTSKLAKIILQTPFLGFDVKFGGCWTLIHCRALISSNLCKSSVFRNSCRGRRSLCSVWDPQKV